ncbi:MAG: hypothetical protein ACR2NZ_22745 [Rubripirellula sp.]
MSPHHSINFCPICGGGLCGIRICGIDPSKSEERFARTGSDAAHGLVICDECDAIWLEPDLATAHQYPDLEDARCPICAETLWGVNSRWANQEDVETLGWEFAVNPELDGNPDEEIA